MFRHRGFVSPIPQSGLSLWLKADAGVTTVAEQFISQVVISGGGRSVMNGTYTRTDGGIETAFVQTYDPNFLMYWIPGDNIWVIEGTEFYCDALDTNTSYYAYNPSYDMSFNWVISEPYGCDGTPPTGSITLSPTGNSLVTAWADQSGNGNNAVPVNNPIYVSSLINSKPSIDFFTNTAYFDLVSNIDPIKTIFCVYKTNTSPQNYQAIVEANIGLYSAIASDQFGTYLGEEIGYSSLTANTSYILMVESDDGINSNGYVNGTAYSDSSGGGFVSRGYVQIGAGQNGTQPCNGYISEVIIYNRVLTTPERQQVEAYLNTKYAIY